MKTNDLLLIAAAGIAIYLYMNRDTSNTIKNLGEAINGISEIFTGAKQGDPAYGWRYFSDGGAIGPDGKYYLNGQYIYG
jgi:hypothetical protein